MYLAGTALLWAGVSLAQVGPLPGMGPMIKPPIAAGTWHNLFAPISLTNFGSGFTGYAVRTYFPASVYLSSHNATQIRVTLGGATGGTTYNSAWFGHASTNQVFDGTQVQLKVATSTTFSAPSNGTVVTDAIAYTFNGTIDLIVSVGNGTSALSANTGTSASILGSSWSGQSANAGTTNLGASTSGPTASNDFQVALVEVFY